MLFARSPNIWPIESAQGPFHQKIFPEGLGFDPFLKICPGVARGVDGNDWIDWDITSTASTQIEPSLTVVNYKFPFEVSVLIWSFEQKYEPSDESSKFKFGDFSIVNDEGNTKKIIVALFWKTDLRGIKKIWLNFPLETGF